MTAPGEAQQRAELRIEQLRALAAEIEPSTVEADTEMRGYLDDADLLAALVERVEAAERDRNAVAEGLDMWRSRALVAEKRLEAAAQENKELLGGLYLTKHNLEKAEARVAEWRETAKHARELLAGAQIEATHGLTANPQFIDRQVNAVVSVLGAALDVAGVPVAEEEP